MRVHRPFCFREAGSQGRIECFTRARSKRDGLRLCEVIFKVSVPSAIFSPDGELDAERVCVEQTRDDGRRGRHAGEGVHAGPRARARCASAICVLGA